MKPQTATEYSFVCVGEYTRDNLQDLLITLRFKKVSQIIMFILEDIPLKNENKRSELVVQEFQYHAECLRPANLFELLFFAKKFPEFLEDHGSIECSQDPYLDDFLKDVQLKLGRVILSFDPVLKGMKLDACDYDEKFHAKYRLVVPKPRTPS